MIKKIIITVLMAGTIFSISQNAYALSQSMTAAVTFIAPLAVSSISNPSFGKLAANAGATVYTLNTSGSVSVVSGTGEALGGSPAAGSMSISGSSSQTIDISASNLTDDGNVTPSAVTCLYGSGTEIPCNDTSLNTATAPGGGKTLKVGLTITTSGNEADGDTAAPSFDITVVYN